jgi:hypothetical protein
MFNYRSDLFIIALVAVFSMMSGYFTVLVYEYAATGLDKSSQTYVTRLLNICFHVSIDSTLYRWHAPSAKYLCTVHCTTEAVQLPFLCSMSPTTSMWIACSCYISLSFARTNVNVKLLKLFHHRPICAWYVSMSSRSVYLSSTLIDHRFLHLHFTKCRSQPSPLCWPAWRLLLWACSTIYDKWLTIVPVGFFDHLRQAFNHRRRHFALV